MGAISHFESRPLSAAASFPFKTIGMGRWHYLVVWLIFSKLEGINFRPIGKRCKMDSNRFPIFSPLQEVAFEAIKAKHQNIHTFFGTKGNSLILELADMILLLSAQMALLEARKSSRPQEREAEDNSIHSLANPCDKVQQYSQ